MIQLYVSLSSALDITKLSEENSLDTFESGDKHCSKEFCKLNCMRSHTIKNVLKEVANWAT